jgi:hypothetical protein
MVLDVRAVLVMIMARGQQKQPNVLPSATQMLRKQHCFKAKTTTFNSNTRHNLPKKIMFSVFT